MNVQKSKIVSRNKHMESNHLFHSKMQRVIMFMNELELNQKVTYTEGEILSYHIVVEGVNNANKGEE